PGGGGAAQFCAVGHYGDLHGEGPVERCRRGRNRLCSCSGGPSLTRQRVAAGLRAPRRRRVAAGGLLVAAFSWPGRADAAGFSSQQFGGEHGNVVETNPTALYYNPGALGFSEKTNLGLYGTLALHSLTWTHPQAADDYPDPAGAQGADTGKATQFN